MTNAKTLDQIDADRENENILEKFKIPVWYPKVIDVEDQNVIHSKYFGNPLLAKNESWPQLLEHPALFVMQLEINKLPEPFSSFLGNQGWLQFFYASEDTQCPDDISDLSLVRILNNSSCHVQPQVLKLERSQKIILDWLKRWDYPREEDYSEETHAVLDAVCDKYGTYLPDEDKCLQGDKLGGWPFWTQGNETPLDSMGELMIPVYQLDAGCFFDGEKVPAHAENLFASDGTGHIFVSKNDPNELKFHWACS